MSILTWLAVAEVDVRMRDSTIMRRLAEDDIKARRAAIRFFSPQHAETRLAFAMEFRNEDQFWGRSSSLYSDGKTFG